MGGMVLQLGWICLFLGSALFFVSATVVSRANAGVLVPYWTRPEQTPRVSVVLRVVAAVLVALGVTLVAPAVGIWSGALVVAAFARGAAVFAVHNHRVEAEAAGD